jgi:guanylate kinase
MVGRLFIVSASSGAGKTTLVNALLERIQSLYNVTRVLTYTTRAPRTGEIHGVDYFFVTQQEFLLLIEQEFFLEWSCAYGAYYGSPASIIRDLPEGRSYIAILDRMGAEQVLKQFPDAVLIWIYTDIDSLRERLVSRETETLDEIESRLGLAKKEIEEEKLKKLFPFHVHNDDFNEALEDLEKLIISRL